MARNIESERVLAGLVSDPKLIRCEHEVDSTMTVAREMLQQTPQAPFWGFALAERQTFGRGRLATRSWVSVTGNLHVTFLCSLHLTELAQAAGLSLVVGCSVASLLKELGASVALKWPNDILSDDGKKLGGILVEIVQSQARWVALLGLGLNLQVAPEGGAALHELLGPNSQASLPTPESFLEQLSPLLQKDVARFEKHGFKVFRELWLSHAYPSEELLVTIGGEKVKVVFLGLSDTGALIVNHHGRVVEINSGEIMNG